MFNIFSAPWKVNNKINEYLSYPLVWLIFKFHNIKWENDWRFHGIPIIQKHKKSHMQFGSGLALRSSLRSNPLGPTHPVILCTWQEKANLTIGKNFAMTGGVLVAAESINIGNSVNIGANTTILDTDFHPLNPKERKINPQHALTSPVQIGDNVFIGMDCLILKGVTIGEGTVIGAGSVVSTDIPASVIAAGNPAKVIRKIDTKNN